MVFFLCLHIICHLIKNRGLYGRGILLFPLRTSPYQIAYLITMLSVVVSFFRFSLYSLHGFIKFVYYVLYSSVMARCELFSRKLWRKQERRESLSNGRTFIMCTCRSARSKRQIYFFPLPPSANLSEGQGLP